MLCCLDDRMERATNDTSRLTHQPLNSSIIIMFLGLLVTPLLFLSRSLAAGIPTIPSQRPLSHHSQSCLSSPKGQDLVEYIENLRARWAIKGAQVALVFGPYSGADGGVSGVGSAEQVAGA